MSPNDIAIKNSLKAMQVIFAGIKDYRVVGSLLVAAINGKPHRELHDIDLLIDNRHYEQIKQRFGKKGFKQVTKNAPGFTWDEFEKPNHLKFGVLLTGEFKDDEFIFKANRWMTLRIKKDYLRETKYKLFDFPIPGIPVSSVWEGLKIASLNSKRKTDKQIVTQRMKNKHQSSLSINQAFHVQIAGINLPYLYTIFSQIYNLIGGIRLRFGRSYDPWV